MVELVDTLVSGTSASRHACSSQVPGRFKTPKGVFFYVCMFFLFTQHRGFGFKQGKIFLFYLLPDWEIQFLPH